MAKMAVVKGGKGKMFGQMGAGKVPSGTTSPTKAGKSSFGHHGGSGKMFGFSGSKPAKPR